MVAVVQTLTLLFRSLSSRKKTVALTVEGNPDLTQTPQQPHPPPKSRSISKSISGSAKLLLDILECVSDGVPLVGLGTVLGAVRVLFEQYEKLNENDADVEGLYQNLERLRNQIEPLKDNIPDRFKEFLATNLAPDLAIISKDIEIEIDRLKKSSVVSRYFSASQDAKAIADLTKRINSTFTDILSQFQSLTLKVVMESKVLLDTIAPQVDVSAYIRVLLVGLTCDFFLVVRAKLLKAPNSLPDSFGRKACHLGTRSGVLKDIEDWLKNDTLPQVFCLSGESGSGKTAIAVTIHQQIGTGSDFRYAGFFCSSTFDDASDPKYIFPTLACQLASRADVYSVLGPILTLEDPTNNSSRTQFKKLLVVPLNKVKGPTLLVIDGLDEFKGSEVCEVLETLFSEVHMVPSLKVIVCCRTNSSPFEQASSKVFKNPSDYCRYSLDDVSLPDLRHDLRLLLAVELKNRGMEPKTIISLCDVINNVECSFFVALTACKEINPSIDSSKQVERFKDLLSRGMNTIYQSLIDQAFSNLGLNDDAGDLLQKSCRDLHAALVVFAFSKNSLDLDGLSELFDFSINLLRKFFSGFPDNILSVNDKTVLIHHSSFQDHLKSGQATKADNSSSQDCLHLYITQALLRFQEANLHRHISGEEDFRRHAIVPSATGRRDRKINSTLSYACRCWLDHLDMINTRMTHEGRQSLFSMLQEFLHQHLLHWLEVLAALGDMERIVTLLTTFLKWLQKHCDLAHSSLKAIVSDAFASFTIFRSAIELSPYQVYHSLLIPWTPSGRRLAELYRHVEASVTIAEVSCHRRQMLSFESDIHSGPKPLLIRLSQDASRVAVVRKGSIEIGENAKDVLEVFLNDPGSQPYIDASFVGKDHILVTTLSRSGCAEVHLWDVVSKKVERALLQHYRTATSKMLPVVVVLPENEDTPSLVALLTSSKVKIWEAETWQEQFTLQCRRDQDPQDRLLALSPHHILIGLRLRKFPQLGGKTKTLRVVFAETPCSATFSRDGDTLAIAGDTGISLYTNILESNVSRILPISVLPITRPVSSLVFSPRGQYLAAVGESFLWAWNIASSEQPLMRLQNEEQQTVSSVVFSANGKYLHCAHICPGSKTALFDMRIMEEPISAQMPVTSLAMSCGGRIATGSNNGVVTIWNSSMTSVLRCWKRERHPSAVASITFSHDGQFVASVSPERVYIRSTHSDLGRYEVAQRLPVQSLPEFDGRFLSPCAFSRDASLFVCIIEADSRPAFAQIWKIASWKLLGEFELDVQDYYPGEKIQSICLSQEGGSFAINGRRNMLAVYDLAYNESSIRIESTQRRRVSVRSSLRLYFSPDSKYILSTAGAFDIELGLTPVEMNLVNAFIQNGWIVDSKGRQRCWIPFNEDICDWASCGSLLVVCTKTLGNVILVAVRLDSLQ
ncbi:hypothetical protein J3R30DRAFT_3800865 [Lentinula aciculospora]|uniref:NACHT domain-containing protein n=1 Tax=Lentinula aciculospora TaxID=153920 RepID=A0A9W9A1R5_9AGAR|nr:hypothetical protein J3R30DRAFT_3800865 [Lentinula aciculospora]